MSFDGTTKGSDDKLCRDLSQTNVQEECLHLSVHTNWLSTNPADIFHFLYQSEFLTYARELYREYEQLLQRYGEGGSYKKKFAVSTQHYSFAVKAFVDVAKKLDMSKYELAIRETKTMEVIQEVSTFKSNACETWCVILVSAS